MRDSDGRITEASYFSLIEVLIAMTVTGIAALGISRLQIIGMEAAMHSELSTRAALIAESRIEQALAVSRAERTSPEPAEGSVEIEDFDMQFNWILTVEEGNGFFAGLIDMEFDYLMRLRCRVSWGPSNRLRSVEIERYVWDYDIEQQR